MGHHDPDPTADVPGDNRKALEKEVGYLRWTVACGSTIMNSIIGKRLRRRGRISGAGTGLR